MSLEVWVHFATVVSIETVYLGDIGQANHVRHNADTRNEDLPSFPQYTWKLIYQCSDETLHSTEL